MLNALEAEAVVSLALMAALADGRSGAEEREQIRSLFEALAAEQQMPTLSQVHQRVLLRQTSAKAETGKLSRPEARQMAFEMAVCVADADGRVSEKEQAFLDDLEGLLGLDHADAVAFERDAVAIAETPAEAEDERLEVGHLLSGAGGGAVLAGAGLAVAGQGAATGGPSVDEQVRAQAVAKDVDGLVLRYAILNGAIELLPQNLATMAILPLQTRMVYAVGKRYGYGLSTGHIKEFIATLGLGATSQMLESFARKALGGLVKKTLGGMAGKVATAATGPMMTFATTFGIGQVAKAYYAGGRTLSTVDLRGLFERDVAKGRAMFEQHRPQIEANARSLSPAAVLDLVRGKQPA